MKAKLIPITLIAWMVPVLAKAEVVSSGQQGFQIKITQTVPVAAEMAYQQFLRVNEWWHRDHTWFGDAQALSISPQVGGCFCEINGEQQALHMTVTYVEPNKELRMTGGLGPLQMLGVHGGMSWSFKPLSDVATEISLHYQVTGYTESGLDKLANIVEQVQALQFKRLVNKLTPGE